MSLLVDDSSRWGSADTAAPGGSAPPSLAVRSPGAYISSRTVTVPQQGVLANRFVQVDRSPSCRSAGTCGPAKSRNGNRIDTGKHHDAAARQAAVRSGTVATRRGVDCDNEQHKSPGHRGKRRRADVPDGRAGTAGPARTAPPRRAGRRGTDGHRTPAPDPPARRRRPRRGADSPRHAQRTIARRQADGHCRASPHRAGADRPPCTRRRNSQRKDRGATPGTTDPTRWGALTAQRIFFGVNAFRRWITAHPGIAAPNPDPQGCAGAANLQTSAVRAGRGRSR
jgi:hypothetical protein